MQNRQPGALAPSSDAEEYFDRFLNRTRLLLGTDAVHRLRGKTVAIAGCGGHGGAAAMTLARMGVGGFVLADPKVFDEPDINRQWGATGRTLGRNKAEVYAEMLATINPDIRTRVFADGITMDNPAAFCEGADILIDCLDIAVPGPLRRGLFRAAADRGLYIGTAAMIGFGGIVAVSSPDGIPMEFFGGFEDDAIGDSKLPALLRTLFVPDHIDRLEATLSQHRAPSIAVSPALLGLHLSVETALVLLGATVPGWRPPVCLPKVLLIEPLTHTHRLVDVEELLADAAPAEATPQVQVTAKAASPTAAEQVDKRRSVLARVGWNTNLLAEGDVPIDMVTDSWGEIHNAPPDPTPPPANPGRPEDVLRGLFGYRYFLTVFRGRFAEALLGKLLARPGGAVVTNGLFPTTRFHLESNGMRAIELPIPAGYRAGGDEPFKGDLDTTALRELLASPDGKGVVAVYVELCNNALGGHPVSLANLRKIRRIADEHGLTVALDPTRAFENAALLRQREPAAAELSLVEIVRELCSLSDVAAASCMKDFPAPLGGFVAVNDRAAFTRLCDLSLAFGEGVSTADRQKLAIAMARYAEWNQASARRAATIAQVANALLRRGVPVVTPAGGHALYVDIAAFLPHVPAEAFPAQALANELYVLAGVRGSVNLGTPEQTKRGISLLRLALPIGRYNDTELQPIVDCLAALWTHRQPIRGLKRIGGPKGVMGEFAAAYKWA